MEIHLLQILDTDGLRLAVRAFLQQASLAFQTGSGEKMLDLAESARQIARECDDTVGEAVALVYMGVAYGCGRDLAGACKSFERASRMFHRMPSWSQRWNEALALICLGSVCASERPGWNVKEVASFQKALDLLEGIRFNYAAGGDVRQVQLLDDICAGLRDSITSA